MPNPVIVLFDKLGVVTLPLPTNTPQVPIPTVGVLPAKVVLGDAAHKVWFGPAEAKTVLLST